MQGIDIGRECLQTLPNDSKGICTQCKCQKECKKFIERQKKLMGKSRMMLTPNQVFNLITDFYYE